jgi:hypothetical protein
VHKKIFSGEWSSSDEDTDNEEEKQIVVVDAKQAEAEEKAKLAKLYKTMKNYFTVISVNSRLCSKVAFYWY